MSKLINKLTNKEKKEKTNNLARHLSEIIQGERKEYFRYENRISKINEEINEIEPKYLREEALPYINETIDYLNYSSKKGYLNQITNFESRSLFKEDIELTINKLKNLRKDNESKKDVKSNIETIKDSLENKIPNKRRYSSRFIFMENSIQKLNFLKTGEISQEDFDEIAYCKKSLEKNKYLKKRYPEKQKDILQKLNTLLEKRYYKKENSNKKNLMKYAVAGTLLVSSIIGTTYYNEIPKNEKIHQKDTSYLDKPDTSRFQAYLVAENVKKDSIYKKRYEKYSDLFEKYSKLNTPIGYTEKEFRAILASIARIETSMGNSKTAGKKDNESGDKWLMGYTHGDKYPEKYAGSEKQIELASKKIKNALEGMDKKYPRVNHYKTKKEKEKYVLSVYNSGKDFKNNQRGRRYVNKTHPFKKAWIDYFNKNE